MCPFSEKLLRDHVLTFNPAFPPCGSSGDPDTWGCKQFTDSMRIEVPEPPRPEDVVDKNPPITPDSTTQVTVCVEG